MQKRILSGSRAFFGQIEGFKSKDFDYDVIDDSLTSMSQRYIHYKQGEDTFIWPLVSADELIDSVKDHKSGAFELCFFLIPEVVKYYSLTIEHIKHLEGLRKRLNKRHEYLGVIFDAYIANNDFILTDDQRNAAYECYKAARPEYYKI